MMSGPSMELRALVHRGFRPVSWKFEERWYQFANALAAQLRFVPIDLGWTKQGLIVHQRMLARPRMIATLLNRLSLRERRWFCHLWPRTSWPRVDTPRPRVAGTQGRALSLSQISLQPFWQRGVGQNGFGRPGIPVCRDLGALS